MQHRLHPFVTSQKMSRGLESTFFINISRIQEQLIGSRQVPKRHYAHALAYHVSKVLKN
jgi:hypothetical protein